MERIRTALALWIIFVLWAASLQGALAASAPINGDGPTPSPTDESSQPAPPAIHLNPDSGSPGITIVISGTGFTPLAGLSIQWDRVISDPMTLGAINPVVGADGSFTLSFTVPPSAAGGHTITAQDTAGLQASAFFRITPTLSLSPTTGTPGDTITIEGNGFTPAAGVSILWDKFATPAESLLGTGPTVGADGSFTLSFTVPKSSAGAHTVTAQDTAGLQASASFTVKAPPPTASLMLEPSAGAAGDLITASGSGFAPSQTVSLYWDGAALTPDDTAIYESGALLIAGSIIRTGPDGSFTLSLKVPEGASVGTHSLVSRDLTGQEAGASFEVRRTEGGEIIPPIVSLTPSSGLPGDTVRINGIGFAPLAPLSLYWDGTLFPSESANQTNADGTFAAPITVPEAAAGYHAIRAQDGSGREASAIFFLRTLSGATAISVKPASGFPGDQVEITGGGFTPSSTLELLWDGELMLDGNTIPAGSDGSFAVTITVPQAVSGSHTITARSGTGSGATAAFHVTPRAGAVLILGNGSGQAGDTIGISGSGFGTSRTVSLDWDSMIPLGTIPTDASGAFSGTITVPDTAAGFHIITASDSEIGLQASSVFIIPGTIGPAGPAGPPGEPCSGCSTPATTTGVAGAALALAAVALGLIVLEKLKKWTIG